MGRMHFGEAFEATGSFTPADQVGELFQVSECSTYGEEAPIEARPFDG
jgi:hypothetical protein